MDQSPKPSGIPRLSRLPVPRSSVKATPSTEDLRSSHLGAHPSSKLRTVPSRDEIPTTPGRGKTLALRSKVSSTGLRRPDAIPASGRPIASTKQNTGISQTLRPRRSILSMQSNIGIDNIPDSQRSPAGQPSVVKENLQEQDNIEDLSDVVGTPRKPSLSERAMDTLQNTPSARRRRSSFFNPENPVRPSSSGTFSSRPGSSHDTQMRPPSRPGSRASATTDFRASTSTASRTTSSSSTSSSLLKKPSISGLRTPSGNRTSSVFNLNSRLPSPGQKSDRARSPSPIRTTRAPVIKSGSQTLAARPLKARASMSGLFEKPVSRHPEEKGRSDGSVIVAKRKPTLPARISEGASKLREISQPKSSALGGRDTQIDTPRKSSMALRDQIAKAKAAKRTANASARDTTEMDVPVIPADGFDFGLAQDPFGQQHFDGSSKNLLKKRIQTARLDGRLNIAAMGLKDIPDEVMTMYDLETQDGSWAECVDLTRFTAAGNEIEVIPDHIFPDVDPNSYVDDEDSKGNQFGGLETLDLHGNLLTHLPAGLRRLQYLTTLNVADNKLNNDCFAVISQITSLRDLKLSNNGLTEHLDSRIANLTNLESLELQHNALTSLPAEIGALCRLRTLNLNENRLTSFPFTAVQEMPLQELFIAKNKFSGTLIETGIELLKFLQVLDITGNSITKLSSSETLSLPALHQLSVSYNRLVGLPDVSTWISLRTLIAEDNNLDNIPTGFIQLSELRNVDFRGNSIRSLDEHIGNMENLDILRISGNPLREKKFAGMSTEDLKRALKARMEPVEPLEQDTATSHDGSFYSATTSPSLMERPTSSDWLVLPGGVLDRSNLKTSSLNPVAAAKVASNNQITILELHHNILREIPSSIGFFAATLTTLNLSHNELISDNFLSEELELPTLKELNISCNTIDSLQPLINHLRAPNLIKLDISFNRLISLPTLKPHFPNLVTLFASNNTIRELSPESVKGLTTLDCSSNEINNLNPRIGLLGGEGGLQRLDVSGNRFRVPKYTVLEKGTEATLAWLRDRVPAREMGALEDAADAA